VVAMDVPLTVVVGSAEFYRLVTRTLLRAGVASDRALPVWWRGPLSGLDAATLARTGVLVVGASDLGDRTKAAEAVRDVARARGARARRPSGRSEAERGSGRDRGPGREPPLPCRLHAKPRRALLSRRLLRVGRRGPAGARAERQLPRSGAPRHDARRTGDRPHQGIVDTGVAGAAPLRGPGALPLGARGRPRRHGRDRPRGRNAPADLRRASGRPRLLGAVRRGRGPLRVRPDETRRVRRAAHSLWWLGSAAAYAALCWLLAANLLAGPLEGSDWPNTLAFADWMSRSFPAIPFWFPYQGGGVSPSAGYAIAPIYLIAGLHVAGVDLVVAGRV